MVSLPGRVDVPAGVQSNVWFSDVGVVTVRDARPRVGSMVVEFVASAGGRVGGGRNGALIDTGMGDGRARVDVSVSGVVEWAARMLQRMSGSVWPSEILCVCKGSRRDGGRCRLWRDVCM